MRQYCSCEWNDKGDVQTLCAAHQQYQAETIADAVASERAKVSNLRCALEAMEREMSERCEYRYDALREQVRQAIALATDH